MKRISTEFFSKTIKLTPYFELIKPAWDKFKKSFNRLCIVLLVLILSVLGIDIAPEAMEVLFNYFHIF